VAGNTVSDSGTYKVRIEVWQVMIIPATDPLVAPDDIYNYGRKREKRGVLNLGLSICIILQKARHE
jgi:hypothetical protein